VESWSLEPIARSGGFERAGQIALRPDGKVLAVGSLDGYVRIFDPLNGNAPQLVKLLVGHGSPVVAIDRPSRIAPDGKQIVCASGPLMPNSDIGIWDAETGKWLHVTRLRRANPHRARAAFAQRVRRQIRLEERPRQSEVAVGW
jgi:WD40 repeat protein